MSAITKTDRIKGCYFGGAIGDALGWPVEFKRLKEIQEEYGPGGIQELQLNNQGKAEITDDTQMTLFVAEGLLKARTTGNPEDKEVRAAFLRWEKTQNFKPGATFIPEGGLYDEIELWARRAPGATCLSAIKAGATGTSEKPINGSKGCGGVMRAAPAGLLNKPVRAFFSGANQAAMTHGHPTGYFAAGAYSMIISWLMEGEKLKTAVIKTAEYMQGQPDKNGDMKETIHALGEAINRHKAVMNRAAAIKTLGEGWTAAEALAIAVYCALEHHNDYSASIITAVNHDGDSDSTGAMTGQIIGTYLGYKAILARWTKVIEAKKAITRIAKETAAEAEKKEKPDG